MLCVVSVPSCKSQNWCYSIFFGVLSDWLSCFLALTWPCAVSRGATVYGGIVVGITRSCDAACNWAFFLWRYTPFSPHCDFCSDVLFCSAVDGTPPPPPPSVPVPALHGCGWLVCRCGLTSSGVVIGAVSAYLGARGMRQVRWNSRPLSGPLHTDTHHRDTRRRRLEQNKEVHECMSDTGHRETAER